MCGFVGIVQQNGRKPEADVLSKMTSTLIHRGPDDHGVWTEGPVALGHRRLSIIDLSSAGRQPMTSETGDLLLVYNGEIYNFPDLRQELATLGHTFRSRTDTEVVLHAYEAWGESCLRRFNGHFAFAIWNKKAQRLFLARDRFG